MSLTPWRTGSAGVRPALPLPPDPMRMLRGGRPLKRWHYVACFGEEVMLCAAVARIGPLPVSWWAVWDRDQRTLAEHTARGRPVVDLAGGGVRVDDGPVTIDLTLGEGAAVETVSPHGGQYAWTRKRAGVGARGTVRIGERRHEIEARALMDESAGYHARHTAWCWSAGVGTLTDGRAVAWNLVDGIHDAPQASERTIWVDGTPHEAGPVTFAGDLTAVRSGDGTRLAFRAEATRVRDEDLLVLASSYEQPFGTFTGTLAGAGTLRAGLGVMERHRARW